MKYFRLVLLALSFQLAPCLAHEDHAVQVAPDGTLSGLPAAYSPAKLVISFADVDGERRVSAAALQIGSKRVQLPMCLLGLINTQRPEDVQVSGSWDHDESVVPYYLDLKLFDPGSRAEDWGRPGFSLLFNLHDARLMQMEVDVAHPAERQLQSIPVDLRARCGDEDLKPLLSADR